MPETFAWTKAPTSFGWMLALVVAIGACFVKALIGFPTEWLLAILAICAIRL